MLNDILIKIPKFNPHLSHRSNQHLKFEFNINFQLHKSATFCRNGFRLFELLNELKRNQNMSLK